MQNRLVSVSLCCLAISALSGCGLFGKEPLDIDGDRINVIMENKSLAPDIEVANTKIKLPPPYVNKSWNQNGGSSTHFMGHLQSAPKLKELWNTDFGKGSSKRNHLIASPISAYGAVFAIDAEGVVTARRLDNGKEIWEKRLKPLNKKEKSSSLKGAGLAEYNQKIYATTGFGTVFCLDMKTGKIEWRKDIGTPIRIAPTVAAGKLLVQTFDNTLYALNINNGEELWKNQTNSEETTLVGGASPAYAPIHDLVVAAFSNGELRAFKASTGTPLWGDMLSSKKRTNSLAAIETIKANPIIEGDVVYAVGYNSVLTAIDIRTGSRIWERELGTTSQPWVAGNYLYVLTNDFELLAMDKNSGKIIWNTSIPKGDDNDDKNGVFASGPLLTDNRLLVTTSNGYIFSISPYTGRIMGYVSIDEGIELSPIMAKGIGIFVNNDAEMTAYK